VSFAELRLDIPAQDRATALDVSVEAVQLLDDAHFIDLHLDLEVPVRLYGYDPMRRHQIATRPNIWFGHTDLPRLREARFTGVMYDIATNPFRPMGNRQATTLANVARVTERLDSLSEHFAVVRTRSNYDAAVATGRTACMITLQGANALSSDPQVLEGELGDTLVRMTLVHLTSSDLGGTSSPLGRDKGLTDKGRDMVERMNAARVFVDLAHSGEKTFWEALEVHSSGLPPIVTHTGVRGVRDHWRNLSDEQIRAIADRGGVVGVMYQSNFLEPVLTWGSRRSIVDHLAHIIEVAGEDVPAIGTDYDGMIIPPADLPDVTHHALLVQDMMDRGWSEGRIRKILGENFLRSFAALRP
jgi:membrane dipeptidase